MTPECDKGHVQSWADQKFGCADCGKRKVQSFTMRHSMKGDMRDYREDLARFPNDPEAYVDGPTSLSKLKDKRKREGWDLDGEFTLDSNFKRKSSGEIAAEAYRRARDKNFVPDEEV